MAVWRLCVAAAVVLAAAWPGPSRGAAAAPVGAAADADDAPPAISESNILLPVPPAGKSLQYLLWASSGCFYWTSTDPTVASVRIVSSDSGAAAHEAAAHVGADGSL